MSTIPFGYTNATAHLDIREDRVSEAHFVVCLSRAITRQGVNLEIRTSWRVDRKRVARAGSVEVVGAGQ